MKYFGLPSFMWLIYKKSFTKQLSYVVGLDENEANNVCTKAKDEYKRIIKKLPEFEKGDRFKTNIVNCALFSSFYLNLKEKPSLEIMTKYYNDAMKTKATIWFCKQAGKKKFSTKDIDGMKKAEQLNPADRNPYSWNMKYIPYDDGSGYEARFYKCGICHLMTELGIKEVIPAMCHLDYAMSEWGNASVFVREYTLALGGPYCDCGYKKKGYVK